MERQPQPPQGMIVPNGVAASWSWILGASAYPQAAALAFALLAIPDTAGADCAPAVPPAGSTVTCSGVDANGFAAPANSPLTINAVGGATVQASPSRVSLAFPLTRAGMSSIIAAPCKLPEA
jgi:hypothetical protein